MFAGADYCEKCGARRGRAEHQDTAATCPGCDNLLRQISVGVTEMFECGKCDGVWVNAEAFERLCADRESQAAVLHHLSGRATPAVGGPVKYRPCTRCGKMMNRVNFGKLSGAVVDVCKGHGTFLDPGELHQIVAFIQGGGLERARARQLEELRAEQKKLDARQRQAMQARESQGVTMKTAVGGAALDPGFLADLIEMIRGS